MKMYFKQYLIVNLAVQGKSASMKQNDIEWSSIEKIPRDIEVKSRENHDSHGKTNLNNQSKKRQNLASRRVSVPYWHATLVANAPLKPHVIR